ncbi:MAG: hypothetical protein HYZ51_01000 [Candidatus Doudnabacteria bacterium]|nr:hypothetical protein [Candidatus Doudnabacteria bacterium]
MGYKDISINLLLAMGDIFSILIIVGLSLLVFYGHKRDRLYELIESEKKKIESKAIAQPFIDGQIKQMKEKIRPELERIERRRQEVLDFMPLFKK